MRRMAFFLVLIVVIGGLLFWLVENNEGSVLISTQHYVIQFSLWTALLTVTVVILMARLVYGILRAALVPGMRALAGRQQRRQARWRRLNNQGMLAMVEGCWDAARRDLLKTSDKLDAPTNLISHITAANAAVEKGEVEEALAILKLAEQSDTQNILAVGLTRARILLAQKRYQEALDQLSSLRVQNIEHPFVMELLAEAYGATGEWNELEKLLPDLERCKVFNKAQMLDYQVLVRFSQLKGLSNSIGQRINQTNEGQQTASQCLDEIQQLWSRIPKPIKAAPEVIGQYVEALVTAGEGDAAESVLRKAINKSWHNDLILQYGNLTTTDSMKQLITGERWLKNQPDNASLLLTLGRLCKRNKLWGKGRDYLDASLKLDSRPETCAELAEVMSELGEQAQSTQLFKRGLLSSLGLGEDLSVKPTI